MNQLHLKIAAYHKDKFLAQNFTVFDYYLF